MTRRTLVPLLAVSILVIVAVFVAASCGDSEEDNASQRLSTVLAWIRSGPVRAEGGTVAWTYGDNGKDARLDLEELPSSNDRIQGPYWALDGKYYWVTGEGEKARSISYEEIAGDPTSRAAQIALGLVASFTIGNPYAVLQSLDSSSLTYSEDEHVIEGRAQVRSVLLSAIPSNAMDGLIEGLEASTLAVRITIGDDGQPLATDVQWKRGEAPTQLFSWQWSVAANGPVPPESSVPLQSVVGP
jgi:hypothetical protein